MKHQLIKYIVVVFGCLGNLSIAQNKALIVDFYNAGCDTASSLKQKDYLRKEINGNELTLSFSHYDFYNSVFNPIVSKYTGDSLGLLFPSINPFLLGQKKTIKNKKCSDTYNLKLNLN